MSLRSIAELDACDNCGASRWEPWLHVDGSPFLKCQDCGRTTSMPRQLEKRLPARAFKREAA
jgi:hypothetical protein